MSQTKMTPIQQFIIGGLFVLIIVIGIAVIATKSFFIEPMWLSAAIFPITMLGQIFEQKQPLTKEQKSLLLLWGILLAIILITHQYTFLIMMIFPIFQMKRMREKLEKEALASNQ